MKANGFKENDKASVSKYGPTVQNTQANGKTTKPMVKAFSTTQMVMFIKDSGLMTKLVDKALIPTKTAPNTLDSGKTTSKMDTVSSNGSMVKCMKESTRTGQRLVKEF